MKEGYGFTLIFIENSEHKILPLVPRTRKPILKTRKYEKRNIFRFLTVVYTNKFELNCGECDCIFNVRIGISTCMGMSLGLAIFSTFYHNFRLSSSLSQSKHSMKERSVKKELFSFD